MQRRPHPRLRVPQRLFLVAALLLLALPVLKMLAEDPRARSEREGRTLADWPPPPASLAALRAWPGAAESWLQDHLGGRDRLLGAMAALRSLLREPGSAPVVFGQGEWLFFTHAARMRLAQGLPWLDQTQREAARRLMRRWAEVAAGAGLPLIILLAPDKETIEVERLPWWARRFDSTPGLAVLLEELRAADGLTVIDLRPLLVAGAAGRQLYWPYDTHWTHSAGYLAYRALHEVMRRRWPDLVPLPEVALSRVALPYSQDLWRMLGHAEDPDRRLEPQPWPAQPRASDTALAGGLRIRERPDLTGLRVILYGDSFAGTLEPWLAETLPRLVMAPIGPASDLAALLRAQPADLLVVVLVERNLVSGLHLDYADR